MGIIRKKLNLVLKKDAYPFQQDAFNEIKDEDYFAIFHEQGLGKTKIAIDIAFYWLENQLVESVMICTKKSLIKIINENVLIKKMNEADPLLSAIIRGLSLRIGDANDLAEKYWIERDIYKSIKD